MPNHMNPDRLAKRCVMLMRLAGKDSLGLMGSARYRLASAPSTAGTNSIVARGRTS